MFDRRFFLHDINKVAEDLLGSQLIRKTNDGRKLTGIIVELEIYTQENDPSSHSFRGKTKRNDVMFGPPGFLYVYFTYGMHYCCNIVCGPEGRGDAILLRAVEPTGGLDIMKMNRYGTSEISPAKYNNLTNGPAKLCKAFGIDMIMNGVDLLGSHIGLEAGNKIGSDMIGRSTRIGISNAKDQYKRYFIKGNPWVSKADKGIKYLE